MNQIIASQSLPKTEQTTTCPYCGVGCGVTATLSEDGFVTAVKGDESHPANLGRLCVKGSALHETVSYENRLTFPSINGVRTSWDDALEHVADKFKSVIAEHGPDSVAFYLSGQLLTEDYYVANKLLKGFIGTANIDTNSRLCMASAVVAHKRAFGGDIVPASYEDLENTDLLVITGSNLAYAHPILYQRVAKAKAENGCKVVVIDPRRTATCDIADIHLALKPGTDGYLFNGLLAYLARENKLDLEYIAKNCDGFEAALAQAQSESQSIAEVAEQCDVDGELLRNYFELFANTEKAITLFSMGINQSSSGVDKGNAIINCHLATGKIGKPGAAPFSITGQPNAMGGREVGGLANQLAAHMGFVEHDIDKVERFWQAPNMARREGKKAIDMFEAIHRGEIKAIWVMATNPVVSMPDADRVKEALSKCEMVVVSECMENSDTAAMADVLLPASTWSEKHGSVTNSERRVSIQRGLVAPPGEARHDWQIMCDFARKMGFADAFNYAHQVEIFREHAALSGFENHGTRAFDISALSNVSLDDYETLKPFQWPLPANEREIDSRRMFEDGAFFTANKRAKLIPINARMPVDAPSADELIMNTGRVRDHWHTMTRTGKSARLHSHISEPFVQIHPDDAAKFAVENGALIQLNQQSRKYIGRAKITRDQRKGEVFTPMHWNAVYASFGRAGALISPHTDPISGQPEFKQCPVKLTAYPAVWQGFLLVHESFEGDKERYKTEYWSKIKVNNGTCYSLASNESCEDWTNWLRSAFPEVTSWVELSNGSDTFYRSAGFSGGLLVAYLALDKHYLDLPDRGWLVTQLGQEIDQQTRYTLLSASEGDDSNSPGRIICSCFQVGENSIKAEIQEGADTAQALGNRLKCGTNCGSCIPELNALVAEFEAVSA